MKKKPYLIGLTGGIASGKSEASEILEKLGATIIDADKVSREVVEVGKEGYIRLKREFPNFFDADQKLMRAQLRKHVFENGLSARLNEIMLPIIIDEIERRISSLSDVIVVIVAPLLIETGMHEFCDCVMTIDCALETRIARLLERDNIDRSLAISIINSQINDEQRNKLSDIVIYNNAGINELGRKIKYYYEKIKKNFEISEDEGE